MFKGTIDCPVPGLHSVATVWWESKVNNTVVLGKVDYFYENKRIVIIHTTQ